MNWSGNVHAFRASLLHSTDNSEKEKKEDWKSTETKQLTYFQSKFYISFRLFLLLTIFSFSGFFLYEFTLLLFDFSHNHTSK